MHDQRTFCRPGLGRAILPGLALAVLLSGGGPAPGGNRDLARLRPSGDIIDFLKKKEYKAVGVLPSKVKRGTRPASYSGGPLSHNITRRLENALIMSLDNDEEAIGIIRDATATATKEKVGNFL